MFVLNLNLMSVYLLLIFLGVHYCTFKMSVNEYAFHRLREMYRVYSEDYGGFVLDLSNRDLDELPAGIVMLDSLVLLDVSNNPGIRRISDNYGFQDLKTLTSLDMSGCGLTEFVEGFCDMEKT